MFAKNLQFYIGQEQALYVIILKWYHREIPCKFLKQEKINFFLFQVPQVIPPVTPEKFWTNYLHGSAVRKQAGRWEALASYRNVFEMHLFTNSCDNSNPSANFNCIPPVVMNLRVMMMEQKIISKQ